MATTRRWQQYSLSRIEALLLVAIAVATVIYFGVLHYLDGRAATYFANLRQTDPAFYLSQLRESQGFADYLAEYRDMEGYVSFKPAAPSFLVGRWTLREEPLRLSPGTAPEQCTDPVTFDYGILLMLESGGSTLRVTYRIEGDTVLLKSAGIGTFSVKLVSYGSQLDHIEFQPPGLSKTYFAYNCGR